MADDVRVTNWPESGSPEEVAFKLYLALCHNVAEDVDTRLQLFAKCRRATRGVGEFKFAAS